LQISGQASSPRQKSFYGPDKGQNLKEVYHV